jgi:hypothetical protein
MNVINFRQETILINIIILIILIDALSQPNLNSINSKKIQLNHKAKTKLADDFIDKIS